MYSPRLWFYDDIVKAVGGSHPYINQHTLIHKRQLLCTGETVTDLLFILISGPCEDTLHLQSLLIPLSPLRGKGIESESKLPFYNLNTSHFPLNLWMELEKSLPWFL